MKKIWVFILGIVTGIILTILFAVIMSSASTGRNSGLNMFERPGDCLVSKSSLKVFQVLEPTAALAMIKDDFSSGAYLLVNQEGKTSYDDQVIKLPAGKCFKQIGTYQYPTKDERIKTVPVVQVM
jgi:hypothetical protein